MLGVVPGIARWGFPEFVFVSASIMLLNPLALSLVLPRCRTSFRVPHCRRHRPQMGWSIFPGRFRRRSVRDGPLVPPLRPPPGLALRHDLLPLHCHLLAIAAPSFETLLLARGAAGRWHIVHPRQIATLDRPDCYAGPSEWASVMSLAIMCSSRTVDRTVGLPGGAI